MDYSYSSYAAMAKEIRAIRMEILRRNPIAVHTYTPYLEAAAAALDEISNGEKNNFTSEAGPRER